MIKSGHVAWLVASLLSLGAVDVVAPIIDIFSLPLPRYIDGFSFSMAFVFLALFILMPWLKEKQVPLITAGEIFFLGILCLWAGMEVLDSLSGSKAEFDLILSCIPLFIMTVATRYYFKVFGDIGILIISFINIAGMLALVHAALLLQARFEVIVPFYNIAELYGRNAMALLLPICLWLLALFPVSGWPVFGLRYNFLAIIAMVDIYLIGARFAALLFLWVIFIGFAIKKPAWRTWLGGQLTLLASTIVVAAIFAYPFLKTLDNTVGAFIGDGRDATSIWSRTMTNFLLMQRVSGDMLFGLGWWDVAAVRAYGYMGHTLYLNVFASYGVIGILPLLLLFALWMRDRDYVSRHWGWNLMFLFVLIASSANNVFIYYGMFFALVGHGHQTSCPSMQAGQTMKAQSYA